LAFTDTSAFQTKKTSFKSVVDQYIFSNFFVKQEVNVKPAANTLFNSLAG